MLTIFYDNDHYIISIFNNYNYKMVLKNYILFDYILFLLEHYLKIFYKLYD